MLSLVAWCFTALVLFDIFVFFTLSVQKFLKHGNACLPNAPTEEFLSPFILCLASLWKRDWNDYQSR